MALEMHDVTSSQIAKIGWEEKTGLNVIFKGGMAVYRYAKVSHQEFQDLLNADSIGSAFNMIIKGVYAHTKHEIEKEETA